MTEPVELRIAELVLDGVDPGDHDAIAEALARHLPSTVPTALDARAAAQEVGRAIDQRRDA